MDFEPNFEEYSYDELLEAAKNIDQDEYPDRYATVIALLNNPVHLSDRKNEQFKSNEVYTHDNKYSTFWPRFLAAFIDGILISLLVLAESFIFDFEYSGNDNIISVINGLQLAIYGMLMHGYCKGQTLGKMVTNVMVVNHTDETEIDIIQALRRESVNLVMNITAVILVLISLNSMQTADIVSDNLSYAAALFSLVASIWAISEFITMLLNKKRRALHDFIGRTVVIRV